MNPQIADQIQQEQNHGRQKYGRGPDDFAHDDAHSIEDWAAYIIEHARHARYSTPLEARSSFIKAAGLCVSAVEALDRRVVNAGQEGEKNK